MRVFIASVFVALLIIGSFQLTGFLAEAQNNSSYNPDPEAVKKATDDFFNNLCSGHGGVNCSVINKDASVVCKDGTIDSTLPSIYLVSQCQESILNIAQQQNDFMSKTGCYPPSTLSCTDNQSYEDLYKILSSYKLQRSELGKDELRLCLQQIEEYKTKEENYRKCLADNGQPKFELAKNQLVLPLIKAAFCPQTFGEKSSYDIEADLCICDKGYFMSDGQCLQAKQVCQSKYGPSAGEKEGNCILPVNTITTPKISTSLQPTPNIIIDNATPLPKRMIITPTPQLIQSLDTDNQAEGSFIRNIFNSIVASIKNIFKLMQ